MDVTFTRFDVADHLKTDEDIADYLDVVAGENDAKLTVLALSNVARARAI